MASAKSGPRPDGSRKTLICTRSTKHFAVQSVAVIKELGIDPARVNVNGGAVALGHPIGASGTRVLVTLIYELIRRNGKRGIAALCLGGGNSVAMAVERI